MPVLLKRQRCRILLGEPDEPGFEWDSSHRVPDLLPGISAPPRTDIRAAASERALHVRFECQVEDPTALAPPAPAASLNEVERAVIDIYPDNDPTVCCRFEADYRGMTESLKLLQTTGEMSLEAVPDTWTSTRVIAGEWSKLHGLHAGGWHVEFIIPWRTLGLEGRPPMIGFGYKRIFRRHSWPKLDILAWAAPRVPILEHHEALIGDESGHPEELRLDCPVFGSNQGRLILGTGWTNQPARLRIETQGRMRGTLKQSSVAIVPGQQSVEFEYHLERAESNHVDVFNPMRLVLELSDGKGRALYRAALPMDRHLGICIDEPFAIAVKESENLVVGTRSAWLARILPELPRFHRADTNTGAASDFCLVHEDGSVAANLMANNAWSKLAGIVESFSSAEERLVAAMALIGQKSVTNLILGPMFFSPEGNHTYHSAMHEWMGPLSILRYGGGPAVARAAVLARLLQHVENPQTGRPFVTRIVALTPTGGPQQVTRSYKSSTNLGPFVQEPGPIGAVAVDHADSQTLLDPTGLVFFPKSISELATVEEILNDKTILEEGAGSYQVAYAGLNVEEMRRHLPDRLLSRGVFPELCPNEESPDSPFDPGYCQQIRALAPGPDGAIQSAGFTSLGGSKGMRDATLHLTWDQDFLSVDVLVEGIDITLFNNRDRASERVHLLLDTAHNHQDFYHLLAGLDGERGAWRETAGCIQTLFKNLSTENHSVLGEIRAEWSAEFTQSAVSYQVKFRIPWSGITLEAEHLPPVIGFNLWVDGRAPHYEQIFLAPPRHRLSADPFSFADLYLSDPPAVLEQIDFKVPTWGENTAQAVLKDRGETRTPVTIQANCGGGMKRSLTPCAPVTVQTKPGIVTVEFPFYLDPSEKMTSGSPQHLFVTATADEREFYRGEWRPTYCGTISIYQAYKGLPEDHPDPKSGDEDFLNRKIRYICARLPQLKRLTTLDGAPSDFVIRAEDDSVEFNLMKEGVLDEIGEFIRGLFDTNLNRILGLFYFAYHPQVARHMSGGHRFMNLAGPLSVLRGNFAGGGGNCGYHSRAFAGLASHLKINGQPLKAHTVGIYGHVISAVEWRGSKALMDADVGHFMLTPDGSDLATIEEFRTNPGVLTTAGPGDLARYFTFDLDHTAGYPGIRDEQFPGVFPPGAPKA